MTEQELDTICARLSLATAGPWWHQRHGVILGAYSDANTVTRVCELHETRTRGPASVDNDAEFICHSKTDIPRLLDEVRLLHSVIRDMQLDSTAYTLGRAQGAAERLILVEALKEIMHRVHEVDVPLQAESDIWQVAKQALESTREPS